MLRLTRQSANSRQEPGISVGIKSMIQGFASTTTEGRCGSTWAQSVFVLTRMVGQFAIGRGAGAHPLPEPESGGNIQDLRQFLNVRDDEAFVLCVGALLGVYNPFGHYMATSFAGLRGRRRQLRTGFCVAWLIRIRLRSGIWPMLGISSMGPRIAL